MVLPAAAAAAQQAYISPLQQKQESLARTPQKRPEDSAQQETSVASKPPVENIENEVKNEIANKQNLELAAQAPEIGSARSQTTERGSLIDLSV